MNDDRDRVFRCPVHWCTWQMFWSADPRNLAAIRDVLDEHARTAHPTPRPASVEDGWDGRYWGRRD